MSSRNIGKKKFKALASKATPKWEVIRRQLRRQLLSGDFLPGDALPSEPVLCGQFGVARNTIRQALGALEKENIIERVQGKGTFLARNKSNGEQIRMLDVFCLILPRVERDESPRFINGFDESALEINHQMMVATTRNDVYRQGEIMLHILDKKMAGVVLVPTLEKTTPPHHIRQMQTNGIPVVLCNRPVEGVSAPLVTWDWEEIGAMAARHFLEVGHRRIGYFANIHHSMAEAHARGLREVMAQAGIPMNPDHIIFTSLASTLEDKKAVVEKWLSRPDRPTAILCNDDIEAENVYWYATEMGLKVPDDLAIIGFGESARDEKMSRMRLTSVTMNAFDIGQKAVQMLVEMRSGARSITDDEVFHIDLSFWQGSTA